MHIVSLVAQTLQHLVGLIPRLGVPPMEAGHAPVAVVDLDEELVHDAYKLPVFLPHYRAGAHPAGMRGRVSGARVQH